MILCRFIVANCQFSGLVLVFMMFMIKVNAFQESCRTSISNSFKQEFTMQSITLNRRWAYESGVKQERIQYHHCSFYSSLLG